MPSISNWMCTVSITTAGLMNVLELTGKKAEHIKIVVNGAGAAGISCAKMYRKLGVGNIIMCDSKGVISTDRTDLNAYKAPFAVETDAKTLEDAIEGADMFLPKRSERYVMMLSSLRDALTTPTRPTMYLVFPLSSEGLWMYVHARSRRG